MGIPVKSNVQQPVPLQSKYPSSIWQQQQQCTDLLLILVLREANTPTVLRKNKKFGSINYLYPSMIGGHCDRLSPPRIYCGNNERWFRERLCVLLHLFLPAAATSIFCLQHYSIFRPTPKKRNNIALSSRMIVSLLHWYSRFPAENIAVQQ